MQSFDYDDEVHLVFVEEPSCVYNIPVLPNHVSGKLRLKKGLFCTVLYLYCKRIEFFKCAYKNIIIIVLIATICRVQSFLQAKLPLHKVCLGELIMKEMRSMSNITLKVYMTDIFLFA